MPLLAAANKERGVAITSALTLPKQETAAVRSRIVAPTGPIIFSATAANGASLYAPISVPSTPCVTICNEIYIISTTIPPRKIPIGTVRLGFLNSPLTPRDVSKPANAKNKMRAESPNVFKEGICAKCKFVAFTKLKPKMIIQSVEPIL